MEIHQSKRQFQWNQLNPEHLLDPSESRMDERAIFQLHWGVDLQEEDGSYAKEMMQHVKDLQSKAIRYDKEQLLLQLSVSVRIFISSSTL